MKTILTIELVIPDEISEVYQTEYLRQALGDKILSPMELPHPQIVAETFDAEIQCVGLHLEGD